MKKQLLLLAVVVLFSCEKNSTLTNAKADEFINQVIAETYDEMYLPDLEPVDISTLLQFRNNKKILSKFPTNPISSMIGDSVTVGNIALWTIESIRISELNGDSSEFKRFPSLNAMVRDTTFLITNKFLLQDYVADKYYSWWLDNSLTENEKIRLNPLKGTNIIWF